MPAAWCGVLTWSALAARILVRLILFFVSASRLPLALILVFVLALKFALIPALVLLVPAPPEAALFAPAVLFIVLAGGEVRARRGRRPSAAYSTSDSQTQRLFVLSLFALAAGTAAGWVLVISGAGTAAADYPPAVFAAGLAGLPLLALEAVSLFRARREILYFTGSFLKAACSGRLRRLWH